MRQAQADELLKSRTLMNSKKNPSHHNSGFSISLVNNQLGNIHMTADIFDASRIAHTSHEDANPGPPNAKSALSPTFNTGLSSKQYEMPNDLSGTDDSRWTFHNLPHDESMEQEGLLNSKAGSALRDSKQSAK